MATEAQAKIRAALREACANEIALESAWAYVEGTQYGMAYLVFTQLELKVGKLNYHTWERSKALEMRESLKLGAALLKFKSIDDLAK